MADLGAGALGVASGAATGSTFGPVGTAIGAIGGGLLGMFGANRKKKPKKLSTLDPTQRGIYNDYASGLRGEGGRFGNIFNFDANQMKDVFQKMYANPAYQNFQENIVPSITGAFRGGNLQNSSYLGGALSKAGTDVQRNLDAHLSNMLYQGQQDAVTRRAQGIQNLLGMQTFAYQQPQASAGDNAFSALTQYGGQALGNLIDNKFGGGFQGTKPNLPSGGTTSTSGINPKMFS